jgi:hypothetical protein
MATLGLFMALGVVWSRQQFYALFFLTITLKLEYVSAYTPIGLTLRIGTQFLKEVKRRDIHRD